jgi:tetratricopeptide (TPR) repeat protein
MRALGSLAEDLELSLMQRLFWIAILLEAGDVRAADREIDACTRYARELRLPRSRLYAESYRAMRDLMQGKYAAARVAIHQLLAEAEDAGDTAGSFMLRLRLALVDAEVASGNVERATDLMHTGVRAHPQMKFFQAGLARSLLDAGRLEDAQRELDRIAAHDFADIPCNETFGLTHALLAEVAASLRDRERSARLYQILRPAAGRFVVIVFAAAVFGSVDRLLGRLAHVCGQLDLARAHFEAALTLERDAGARPALAHTLHDHAVLLAESGEPAALALAARQLADAQGLAYTLDMQRLAAQIARTLAQHPQLGAGGAVAQPAPAPSREEPPALASTRGVFEREGDYWTLAHAGEVVRVRDLRGLSYLAALLARPHDSIPALDLIAEVAPRELEAPAAFTGDAGELLDADARRAYVARLRELSAELEEARDDGDIGRAERLAAESELLQQELSRAFGLTGRARVAGSAAERARVSVTRAIRKAIDEVERVHPALGKHLRQSVRTGRLCSYEPTLETAPGWKI